MGKMKKGEYLFEKFDEVHDEIVGGKTQLTARMVLTHHIPQQDDFPAVSKEDPYYTYQQLVDRQTSLAKVNPALAQPSYEAEVRETDRALNAMRSRARQLKITLE